MTSAPVSGEGSAGGADAGDPGGASLAAIFVVEGDKLAAQSMLFVSAFRRHAGAEIRLIAYLPRAAGAPPPELPDDLLGLYADLGVETRELPQPDGFWDKPYPHGNKIFAAAAPREVEATFFFDTDTILCRDPGLPGLMKPGKISAVPEGVPSWGHDSDRWPRAYDHFGLPVPDTRVTLTRGRRIDYVPYFNAGFLGFWDGAVAGPRLADIWRDTAQEIDRNLRIGQKRPWLDQIALPIACERAGIGYNVLRQNYNYSVSDRPVKDRGDRTIVMHYHELKHGAPWPEFRQAQRHLDAQLPPSARTRLAQRFGEYWCGTPA
ncbi:hypothetical protein EKE94_08160 [Mesobaculum littorinae]|uniref:Uncharacterized protein n=1 Tax=Mesobaculum littorinae TaxID=2486419 RepID=A0A438AJS5_9RHOB|nr:hypothetical protein [Mesobaculum littorinae]RVV98855.1 hypothetical protein EKE94_08160 [Mesobaculum littorinae]